MGESIMMMSMEFWYAGWLVYLERSRLQAQYEGPWPGRGVDKREDGQNVLTAHCWLNHENGRGMANEDGSSVGLFPSHPALTSPFSQVLLMGCSLQQSAV